MSGPNSPSTPFSIPDPFPNPPSPPAPPDGALLPPTPPTDTISGNQVLDLAVNTQVNVDFAPGAAGTLEMTGNPGVGNALGLLGAVSGFGPGDAIDLVDVAFASNPTAVSFDLVNQFGGELLVTEGDATVRLALLGNYSASTFVVSSDGHGGSLITEAPATQHTPTPATPHP
jgi:hypothetical protein